MAMCKAFEESQERLSKMVDLQRELAPFTAQAINARVTREADPPGNGTQCLQKSSTWQTIQTMTLLDCEVVATYEPIFEYILNMKDPGRLDRLMTAMHVAPSGPVAPAARVWDPKPDGTGTIYEKTMDDAVAAGLVTADEANELNRRRCWDKRPFAVGEVVEELAADIKFFTGLNDRLSGVA